MRNTLFVISCAVVAFFDRCCGRELAINSVAEAPDPALAVGLPTGLSSTAVAARKAAMVAAGTPPMYAEKFAIDAEQQQAWHDNPKSRQGEQAGAKTPAEKEAKAILDAQELEPSKLKSPSEKNLEERQEIVSTAASAAEDLAGRTIDQLKSIAAQYKVDLEGITLKADIVDAILKSAGYSTKEGK
jgi:hypothetical protein